MARQGPRNTITDVPGLKVGAASDFDVRTGVSVIVPDRPGVCAVDVRGGGPGTRETDLLAPENMVGAVDAICLSGGSVYGLAAADGVVAAMGAQGRGFLIAPGLKTAPIVPGAILFDLANGGNKEWGATPPYRDLGMQALAALSDEVELGSAGAGVGAMAGAIKGGLGSASLALPDGAMVGALAVVNAFGSVLMPNSNVFWAWPFEIEGEFGGRRPSAGYRADPLDWGAAKAPAWRANTSLGVVATDYALSPAQAKRVAIMAQDGFARAIRPAHAMFDGDVVFALSTGQRELPEPAAVSLTQIGAAAADVLARAVARGVYAARRLAGEPAWADLAG